MTVTSVALQSATELKFTGTLFPSETCEGYYMSLVSDSCTVESATSVVATFNGGVPTSPTDVTPELRFNATDGSHYAKFDTAAVISNPLSITATTSGLVSSFAGGRTLQVTANGLTSDVTLGNKQIRVCEKQCVAKAADSTGSVYSCSTPPISTTQSNSQFFIQDESNLKGERLIYSGMTAANATLITDGAILPSIQGSTADCYVGIQMPTDYIGVLGEVSFFLDEFDRDTLLN